MRHPADEHDPFGAKRAAWQAARAVARLQPPPPPQVIIIRDERAHDDDDDTAEPFGTSVVLPAELPAGSAPAPELPAELPRAARAVSWRLACLFAFLLLLAFLLGVLV